MVSHLHAAIIELIEEIDTLPADGPERDSWVRAERHLHFLRRNSAASDEVVLHLSSKPSYVLPVVVRRSDVTPPDHDDLLGWSFNAYGGRSSYVQDGAGKIDMDYECSPGPHSLRNCQRLVFVRDLPDVPDTTTYELLQEFTHAEGILWRDEQRAYCRVDGYGNWSPVVSITDKGQGDRDFVLITCQRDALERYLVATDSILVRFFDLTMIPIRDDFHSWEGGSREQIIESDRISYIRCVHPDGYGYTRGVQLISPLSPAEPLFKPIFDPWDWSAEEHASFTVLDFRHNRVVEVSTDRRYSTSYFDASKNDLPFETSPAFFDPEVLAKYKADREKYTVDEENGTIRCRGSWSLRHYDINPAGQVHAYLYDLRQLPYREQLHWKSHNEDPKDGVSKRAYESHFLGQWPTDSTPLERILDTVNRWASLKVDWWQIEDREMPRRINTPISDSRDEWGTAFLELSKVVIEGFRKVPIQAALRRENILFESDYGTLTLLERLLSTRALEDEGPVQLKGLKEAQLIRTKAHSHSAGSEADRLTKEALTEHGTYRGHFEWVCSQIANELETIGVALRAT